MMPSSTPARVVLAVLILVIGVAATALSQALGYPIAPYALPVAIVVAALSLLVHGAEARHHGHGHSVRHLAARHGHLHAAIGVLVFAVVSVAAFVALTKAGGATFDPHRRIAPAAVRTGGGALPLDVDNSDLIADPGSNQGNTNACVGWTTVRLIRAEHARLGQEAPGLSGFYTYQHTSNGPSNGYTSFDQEVASTNNYGVVPISVHPSFSYSTPASWEQGYAHEYGASLRYLWYGNPGSSGLYPIMAALAQHRLVGGLFEERWSLANSTWWGAAYTDDNGSLIGYHAMTITGYHVDPSSGAVYLRVANTWGSSFGQGGSIWFTPTGYSHIVAAVVISPGRYSWPVPAPVVPVRPTARPRPTATPRPRPTATARPRPTATPRPRPTATPRPRPTATPHPIARSLYSVTVPAYLRRGPGAGTGNAQPATLLRAGWRVYRLATDPRTPRWAFVHTLNGRHGWALKVHLRSATPTRPTPRPTARPTVRPTATPTPRPTVLTVTVASTLRSGPSAGSVPSRPITVARKGWHLTHRHGGPITARWIRACPFPTKGRALSCGWIDRSHVR